MALVDIHIHADDHVTNKDGVPARHGESPDRIANAVIQQGLDGYVVLAHQSPTAEFFKVEEEIAELTQNTAKEIWGILGMESVIHFQNHKFHLGFLYEDNYSPFNLPAQFDKLSGLKGIEQYIKDYPCAVILWHPGIVLRKKTNYCQNSVLDLCNSGLIDGVEILNGSTILRGGHVNRELALAMLIKDNLSICGGSDAHREGYVGMCATGFGNGVSVEATAEKKISDLQSSWTEGLPPHDLTTEIVSPDRLPSKATDFLGRSAFFYAIRNCLTTAHSIHPQNVIDVVRDELCKLSFSHKPTRKSSLSDFIKIGK